MQDSPLRAWAVTRKQFQFNMKQAMRIKVLVTYPSSAGHLSSAPRAHLFSLYGGREFWFSRICFFWVSLT